MQMYLTDRIKTTTTYKALDNFQQLIALKKGSIEKITLGINMSNNIGFDRWVKVCSPVNSTKSIVKELLNQKEK